MFRGREHKGIAAERQLRKGPGQQALVLGAAAAGIDQQQIEIAADPGVTPPVAAEAVRLLRNSDAPSGPYRAVYRGSGSGYTAHPGCANGPPDR